MRRVGILVVLTWRLRMSSLGGAVRAGLGVAQEVFGEVLPSRKRLATGRAIIGLLT